MAKKMTKKELEQFDKDHPYHTVLEDTGERADFIDDDGKEHNNLPVVKIDRGDIEYGYFKPGTNVFLRHRETDNPAVERHNGDRCYHKHGTRHREIGKPACYNINEDNHWETYNVHGALHNPNGPAQITPDGNSRRYYINGELHREDGPAINTTVWEGEEGKLQKNHKIQYMLTGLMVPEKVVMDPKSLDPRKDIMAEENLEVRRIMIERYGWVEFLEAVDAETLDKAPSEIENTLETLVSFDDHVVFIGACPSTGRIYAMEVENTIKTIPDAKNYLQDGLDPNKCLGAT